jgi:hypothetical protein
MSTNRHVPIDPSILRAGDIVEIAFSCVAVPTKTGKRMMYLNLRALTLLDDSVRKVRQAMVWISRQYANEILGR